MRKFITKKYFYNWGCVYDPETGDKVMMLSDSAYGKMGWVWILTYQESDEKLPKIIRFLFVDEDS